MSTHCLETLLFSNRMSYIKSCQQTYVHISQYVDCSCNIPSIKNTSGKILINQKKHKQRVCFDFWDILLIMQISISQAEIYEKLNQIYLLESRGNTLGESTPPNHRREQLNGLLRSTPELDHQPCTRTASNFLAALYPQSP